MNDPLEILKQLVQAIQEQQGYQKVDVQPESNLIYDLGFKSLDIAQLIAMAEVELGIDPFSSGATLDQISTIKNMASLYSRKT